MRYAYLAINIVYKVLCDGNTFIHTHIQSRISSAFFTLFNVLRCGRFGLCSLLLNYTLCMVSRLSQMSMIRLIISRHRYRKTFKTPPKRLSII